MAALATRVERSAGVGARKALAVAERPERIPLSAAQSRMWFLNRFDTASGVNNIPVAIRLTGALDVEALSRAVNDVVGRHETLRTVYPPRSTGWATSGSSTRTPRESISRSRRSPRAMC